MNRSRLILPRTARSLVASQVRRMPFKYWDLVSKSSAYLIAKKNTYKIFCPGLSNNLVAPSAQVVQAHQALEILEFNCYQNTSHLSGKLFVPSRMLLLLHVSQHHLAGDEGGLGNHARIAQIQQKIYLL